MFLERGVEARVSRVLCRSAETLEPLLAKVRGSGVQLAKSNTKTTSGICTLYVSRTYICLYDVCKRSIVAMILSSNYLRRPQFHGLISQVNHAVPHSNCQSRQYAYSPEV